MRQCTLAVVERKTTFDGDMSTEPYEVGWASEAIFFVEVEATQDQFPTLDFRVEISPDGIRWVDEGTCIKGLSEGGLHFVKVSHFGGWLRLSATSTGRKAPYQLTVRLSLKE